MIQQYEQRAKDIKLCTLYSIARRMRKIPLYMEIL